MPVSTEVFWRAWVWHLQAPLHRCVLGMYNIMPFQQVERESVSIGVRIRPGLLAIPCGRKKGFGTGVILCPHWFHRLFTCKCFSYFPFAFQHVYSEGKRFAQWWLQESCRAQSCQGQEMEHRPFAKAIFFLIRSAVTQGKGPSTGPDASLVVRK